MRRGYSTLLLALPAWCLLAQTPHAQSPDTQTTLSEPPNHWFVLGGQGASAPSTINTAPGAPKSETVEVIAKRRDRSWRSKVTEHLNDPLASDAARPRNSFENEKTYCNSALRTVGGQPASAGDMVAGVGAGGC